MTRDPVSELWDEAARRLLMRAYRAPYTWQGTRLLNPTAGQLRWALARGINVLGPDPVAGRKARTRWARGFVRACYHQHRYWWNGRTGAAAGWRRQRRLAPIGRPLRVDIGAWKPVLGAFPAGRAVRVQLARGGAAAQKAVAALPDSRRIYDSAGNPAGAHTDAGDRDWA